MGDMIDWNRIKDAREREMIQDLHAAVQEAGALHLFQHPKCPNSLSGALDVVTRCMKYDDHTGFTFAWSLAHVHTIILRGFDAYIQERKYPE